MSSMDASSLVSTTTSIQLWYWPSHYDYVNDVDTSDDATMDEFGVTSVDDEHADNHSYDADYHHDNNNYIYARVNFIL